MKKTLWKTMWIGAAISAATGLHACADSASDPVNALNIKASAVSECGGFGTSDMALTDEVAAADYCDAEVLEWWYDKETGLLSLSNKRVVLNCCGDHRFNTELDEDGTYIVTEIDSPQKTSAGSYDRCGCECAFDYEISLENIPGEPISFRLLRDVTERESVDSVWEGTLDLSESSSGNTIITSEEEAPFCESDVE